MKTLPIPNLGITSLKSCKLLTGFFIISISLLDPHYTLAQEFKGQIVDKKNQIIPYAHIYFQNAKVGTYSNDSGYFYLNINNLKETDTLVFSHVSFEERKISAKEFPELDAIILQQRKTELQSIEVFSLSAKEMFFKIKEATNKALSNQVNTSFYEIYEASLNGNKAWRQSRFISYRKSENSLRVQDSIINMTSYSNELTNIMGGLSFSYGDLTELYNSIYFKELFFESLLKEDKLQIKFSDYTGQANLDTLYIMDNNIELGYLCYDINNKLALELHFDVATSKNIKFSTLLFKSIFRIATKRNLKSVDRLEIYQQYYQFDNGQLVAKNLKMNFELIAKKRGETENLLYQKSLYQTNLRDDRGEALKMQISNQ